MLDIMRTTIAIDDHLLEAAKHEARRRDMTLGQFVEEALRSDLAGRAERREAPDVPIFRGGTGVRPGIEVTSTRALLEALDEDQPLEQLR